jgi:hypothetical protein
MKCREVRYYLTDYHEGKLINEIRKEISLHLQKCRSCNKRSVELKAALRSAGTLNKKIHHGEGFWEGVSDQNENDPEFNLPAILYSPLKTRDDARYKLKSGKRFFRSGWIALGAPLAAVLLAVLISVLYFSRTKPAFWEVETLKGTPVVANVKINGSGTLQPGEWLITDSHSGARLKAGITGEVNVQPGSEVQLVDTKDRGPEIYLKKGSIYTKNWIPAKHFSVITPSVSAVDLGSSYTIEVDENGSSFLHVIEGYIAVGSGKYEEIVPAGAVCEAIKNNEPGTPYFLNASTEFKAALSRFDSGNGTQDDLETILENSDSKDALSLWYLLKYARPDDVKPIYDRLAELLPPSAGVTYEGIRKGDNKMLLMWWEKLGYGDRSIWDSLKD